MRGGKIIKVCGMREEENIRAVEALGIDIMGFIFYPRSPRHAAVLPGYLPGNCRRAGVFVNADIDTVLSTAQAWGLDTVQLHADETPAMCDALRKEGLKVLKALSIASADDFARAALYEGHCDMLLFDTATQGYGGSGRKFDHSLLARYRGTVPFLLSGGIGPDDASELACLSHPCLAGYDLNSRFETAPGHKNPQSIDKFLNELSKYTKI